MCGIKLLEVKAKCIASSFFVMRTTGETQELVLSSITLSSSSLVTSSRARFLFIEANWLGSCFIGHWSPVLILLCTQSRCPTLPSVVAKKSTLKAISQGSACLPMLLKGPLLLMRPCKCLSTFTSYFLLIRTHGPTACVTLIVSQLRSRTYTGNPF